MECFDLFVCFSSVCHKSMLIMMRVQDKRSVYVLCSTYLITYLI